MIIEAERDPSPKRIEAVEYALQLYREGMELVVGELQTQLSGIDPVIEISQLGV